MTIQEQILKAMKIGWKAGNMGLSKGDFMEIIESEMHITKKQKKEFYKK